jgi:glyoxylase-like metal-dependent hydrolase (beta-lactamase superfamily II)
MDNLYVFEYDTVTDRPNIGYIKGDKYNLMIDCCGGLNQVTSLKSWLKLNNLSNPDYIVLTHHHWDHSFGLAYFDNHSISSKYTKSIIDSIIDMKPRKLLDIISNEYEPMFCIPHLKLEYDNCLSNLKLKRVNETTSYKTIDLGNRLVDIKEVRANHTLGSLFVYDRASKYLFIGDADCGVIDEVDFIVSKEDIKNFLLDISEFDYEYVVRGHSYVVKKNDYLKEIGSKFNVAF